jgi:hypothetical protein
MPPLPIQIEAARQAQVNPCERGYAVTLAAGSTPRLLGAPRYSTKCNRFVFGIVDHELFVAVAVDPRICTDWCPEPKVSYGECLSLISLRRDEVERDMQALISGGETTEGNRLDLWQRAEMEAAF